MCSVSCVCVVCNCRWIFTNFITIIIIIIFIQVLYDFLTIISTNGSSLCRCFNIIKALVAYLIGEQKRYL